MGKKWAERINKQSLRNLWYNYKRSNIYVIVILKGKEKKCGAEKIFKEIMAKDFTNLAKSINVQI